MENKPTPGSAGVQAILSALSVKGGCWADGLLPLLEDLVSVGAAGGTRSPFDWLNNGGCYGSYWRRDTKHNRPTDGLQKCKKKAGKEKRETSKDLENIMRRSRTQLFSADFLTRWLQTHWQPITPDRTADCTKAVLWFWHVLLLPWQLHRVTTADAATRKDVTSCSGDDVSKVQ